MAFMFLHRTNKAGRKRDFDRSCALRNPICHRMRVYSPRPYPKARNSSVAVDAMQLSTKGRYAVMALVDLATQQNLDLASGPICLADIAHRQQLSMSYLEQLFGKLRRAGLVCVGAWPRRRLSGWRVQQRRLRLPISLPRSTNRSTQRGARRVPADVWWRPGRPFAASSARPTICGLSSGARSHCFWVA